jgi:hypothetical protein
MDLIGDRIGIIIKEGKLIKTLVKRYFFIDSRGVMYYTEKFGVVNSLPKISHYNEDILISTMNPVSKKIKLKECVISSIKNYVKNEFELLGRRYFELTFKEREYRPMYIFAWQDNQINYLHSFINSFRDKIVDDESEMNIIKEKNSKNVEIFVDIDIELAKNSGNDIETALEGKLVHQNEFYKNKIKVINPTSDEYNYMETWCVLENGSNYSGPVINGMPNGEGQEYRHDGLIYKGNFRNGKWHGIGWITKETLDSFPGEFIDGRICGIMCK